MLPWKIFKSNTFWWRYVEKVILTLCWWQHKWRTVLEASMEITQNTKSRSTIRLSYATSRNKCNRYDRRYEKDNYTLIFITAQFAIASMWKESFCLSTDDQMHTCLHAHSHAHSHTLTYFNNLWLTYMCRIWVKLPLFIWLLFLDLACIPAELQSFYFLLKILV